MSNACEDSVLDREIEIARCLHSLRLEGVMGELLRSEMVNLLHQLFLWFSMRS